MNYKITRHNMDDVQANVTVLLVDHGNEWGWINGEGISAQQARYAKEGAEYLAGNPNAVAARLHGLTVTHVVG